jgi:hypothetical protein
MKGRGRKQLSPFCPNTLTYTKLTPTLPSPVKGEGTSINLTGNRYEPHGRPLCPVKGYIAMPEAPAEESFSCNMP